MPTDQALGSAGAEPAAQPIPRLAIPELDRCIQCGFCLPPGPTYGILGMDTESPRGRIHLIEAVAQGRIPIDARFEEHMYVCLGCRACETVCPSGVKFGTIIEAARAEIGPTGSPAARRLTRLALRHLMPFPGRLRLGAALLRLYQRSRVGTLARALHLVPRRLAEMEALLPPIPDRFFTPPREVFPAIGPRRARGGLLRGCVMSLLFAGRDGARPRRSARRGPGAGDLSGSLPPRPRPGDPPPAPGSAPPHSRAGTRRDGRLRSLLRQRRDLQPRPAGVLAADPRREDGGREADRRRSGRRPKPRLHAADRLGHPRVRAGHARPPPDRPARPGVRGRGAAGRRAGSGMTGDLADRAREIVGAAHLITD